MNRTALTLLALGSAWTLAGCDYLAPAAPGSGDNSGAAAVTPPPPPPPPPADSSEVPNVTEVVAPDAPIPTAPLRPNGTVLDNPDDQNVALLYYSFAPPAPLQEWIDDDVRRSGANEFQRGAVRQKLETQFRRLSDEAAAVGRVVLHVNANLSEYDAQAGKYYVDLFSNGTTMSWDYRGKRFQIDFVNAEDAHGWSLTPDAAQKVLDRNSGNRSIVVTATVDLVGHHARADGGVLEGRVLSYVVDGRWQGTRLGSVSVVGAAKP